MTATRLPQRRGKVQVFRVSNEFTCKRCGRNHWTAAKNGLCRWCQWDVLTEARDVYQRSEGRCA